ncbi:MAG TPA: FlgD immunoglobulin-like domain containing protein, partial [Spirochaetia bacterium]|nr:FlgD immunoglobulin-like domain containing protein [Spirochaetia bacterium]
TTTGGQTYTGAVTLGADTTLASAAGQLVSFGSTVNGAHALAVAVANASFGGTVGATALTTVSVAGTTAMNGGAITTTGGQTYTGGVTLGADTTLTAGGGQLVSFGSTVNGAHALGVAVANASFGGVVGTTALTTVSVAGTTAMNGGAITTTGGQTYTGAVTLGAATTLTGGAGQLVWFQGTLDGGHTFAVVTANARFDAAVGATALSSISVAGTTAMNGGAITTTGGQTYTGAVTLGADTTLASAAGQLVSFGSTVNGAHALAVSVANASFGGTVGNSQPLSSLSVGGTTAIATTGITTTGVQTYTGAVTLGASTTLSTTNAAVGFSSTVNAASAGTQGLTLALGSGTATASSTIGLAAAIGNLSLASGTLAMGANGLYVAGGISRTSGVITSTGTVTLNGAVAQLVDFTSSTLTNLAVDNSFGTPAQVTATGLVSLLGSLSLTQGTLSIGATGLSIGGSVTRGTGQLSSTGTVTLNGATAANVADVTFYNLVIAKATPATTVTSTGGWTVTNSLTMTQGTWLASDTLAAYTHTIAGGWDSSAANFTFTATSFSTIVLSSAGASIKTKGIGTDPFYNLTVSSGGTLASAVQSLAAVTISSGGLALNGFDLSVGTNLGGAGTLAASSTETVTVANNWSITGFTPANSTVSFTAAGAISPGSAATFYTLRKNGAATTTTFNENLVIIGGVTLSAGVLANGGAYMITVGDQAGSPAVVTWDSTGGGTFSAGTGKVDFRNVGVQILGSNTFYDFYVDTTPSTADLPVLTHPVTISFSAYLAFSYQTTVTHDFHAKGTSTLGIDFQSAAKAGFYTSPPPDDPTLTHHAPAPPDYAEQWVLNVQAGATATIDWAAVQLSWANPAFVTPGPNCVDRGYNRNWYFVVPIVASWTLDTSFNGPDNGRIDRIRVQVKPGTQLSDDFSGFQVAVDGYTLRAPYFQAVGANTDVFDILLNEGTVGDTDATPTWRVISNSGSLYGLIGGALVDHDPNKVYTAASGARPVITFTAAAVGSNKVYVHLSGLAYADAAGGPLPSGPAASGLLTVTGNSITSIVPVEKSGNGAHALIVTLGTAVAAIDVFPVPQTFSAGTGLLWGRPYPANFQYPTSGGPPPSPPYPSGDPGTYANTNADGQSYLPATGTAMLNAGTTPAAPGHAVSDVGIGFVVPVFALDRDIVRDPVNGGVGLVNLFDGTKWLPPQNALIEARVMVLPAYANATVNLYWDTNPPAALDFRNLWIPTPSTTLWPGAQGGDRVHYPGYNGVAGAVPGAPPSAGSPLRDYLVPSSNAAIKDGAHFQFVLTLDDGAGHVLPCVYQDPSDPGAVRPFGYDLHSIIQQRGEVTVTNNVINPAAGQLAYLHYVQGSAGAVTITVFDMSGSVIKVLARGQQAAGTYTTSWDGKNRNGAAVARGVYFIRVIGPGFDEIRKVLVVR